MMRGTEPEDQTRNGLHELLFLVLGLLPWIAWVWITMIPR